MKKYFILFFLSLALLGCEKHDEWNSVNVFTFDVDGVHYDFSSTDPRMQYNELNVHLYRNSETSLVDSIEYYFTGYNPKSYMDWTHYGIFIDRSVQKQTVFNVPDSSIRSYFGIRFGDGLTYKAISGYLNMKTEINLDTEHNESDLTKNDFMMHGTFDFIMVNSENESDTIHVTNGKLGYRWYSPW